MDSDTMYLSHVYYYFYKNIIFFNFCSDTFFLNNLLFRKVNKIELSQTILEGKLISKFI